MRIQITKRGSGSAHLGPASGFMFRRGPLLAPEDAGGGAAAAPTGSETTTIAPTVAPSTTTITNTGDGSTAPGGSAEKMLPQSQVNSLVANARREGREAALRELQQQQASAQQQQQAKPAAPKTADDRLAALEAELAETKARSVFEKHAARLGLDDAAAEDLFALYKVQRPENVSEWLEGKVTRFGLKPAPAPSTQTTAPTSSTNATTAAPAEPAKPPAAAPTAPARVDPITSSGLVDIFNLSDAQLMQLGPQGLRTEYEKILSVGRQQAGAPPRPQPAARK